MKRILFESAPEYIIVCVVVAIAYGGLQYYRTKQQPWGKNLNRALFALRTVFTFLIVFLLLGPIVKQISNIFEKPHYVILRDNSASIKEVADTVTLNNIQQQLNTTKSILEEKGYEVSQLNLNGESIEKTRFELPESDIHGALRKITNRFEGQNIAGVILVSDGIYNSGLSPLYGSYNFPIHTVGLGDTTERMDVAIKNVAYNKIAYQGNRFPVRAEVQLRNLMDQEISVSLMKKGKLIEKQTKKSGKEGLITFDFQPLADEQGIQKLDLQVDVKPGEQNSRNNRASVFVEVVEGRKKILLVAPSPHPDIKVLREVIGKNSNYEFLLHIPGISEQQPSAIRNEQIDLVIFHQSPDLRGKTNALFQSFVKSKSSLLLILGQQSNLQMLEREGMPISYDNIPVDFDEVTAVVNPTFSHFTLSEDAATLLSEFPPVYVHFGKNQIPLTASTLLYQRVGSVSTEKPLLAVDIKESRKVGIMLGEGLWRWKLNEFDRTESSVVFDEVFGKLIQFLSTTEDKRKFRSYPVKQEFSDNEPIVFESQVYNDIFEPVYGNSIEIFITDESGKKTEYTYVTSPGNTRYQIGGLAEGVYHYRSRTILNGKTEEVRGQFAVIEQQAERQNLTADFDLLRKLSNSTGGKFFVASGISDLEKELQKTEAKSVIHTEESYDSLINLKWVFWMLLVLVSAEWFLRKYYGSY
jgi:hypothetical protein